MSKVLLDTNILVYAHHKSSPHHNKAQKVILSLIAKKDGFCSWQNLLEFYNVVTDKRKVPYPFTPNEVLNIISKYQQSGLNIISPSSKSYKIALSVGQDLRLLGKQRIFDALIVATMKEWDIATIYTNDVAHFSAFSNIKTINPL